MKGYFKRQGSHEIVTFGNDTVFDKRKSKPQLLKTCPYIIGKTRFST